MKTQNLESSVHPAPSGAVPRGASVLRKIVARTALWLLRVRVTCPRDVCSALLDGGAIVTSNHVSLLDGPLIALTSPAPLVFGVDTDYSRRSTGARRGMALLAWLGCGAVVALDAQAPFGLRSLARALRSGKNVMVFPEGRIVDSEPLPVQPGLAWLEQRAGARRISITIRGAQDSLLFAKRGRTLLPPIHLEYSLLDDCK